MRIPMTPEAKAAWGKECREADKKLAAEPLKAEEISEDTDKFAFPNKKERSEKTKQKEHERWLNNKPYYRQKHKEWYYRNRKAVLAKEKAKRQRKNRSRLQSKAAQ